MEVRHQTRWERRHGIQRAENAENAENAEKAGKAGMRSTLPLFPTDDGWPYPDVVGNELAADAPDLDCLELFGPHAFDSLSVEEHAALQYRFGLHGGDPLSMKEVAVLLGCTRSEASAIVGRAIDKMRTQLLRE